MNRAARIAVVAAVALIVVVAASSSPRHPLPTSARHTLPVDPAAASAAVAFVTDVGDVDPAHPRGDLTALADVAAPDLVAAIGSAHQPAVAARSRVEVVDVATLVTAEGSARVFVTATLTTATIGASRVAVGYLLTLQRTPLGWRVTEVMS